MLLGAVGLFAQPEDEVGAPVADVAADLEAAGSAAEVAPVAKRAFGNTEEVAGLVEGEHLLAGVAARVRDGGLGGHGMTPGVITAGLAGVRWALPHEAGVQAAPTEWRNIAGWR